MSRGGAIDLPRNCKAVSANPCRPIQNVGLTASTLTLSYGEGSLLVFQPPPSAFTSCTLAANWRVVILAAVR